DPETGEERISERPSMTTPDDSTSTAEMVDNLVSMAAHRRKLREAIRREDFIAYLPMHNYVYMPTREPWPGSSVNAVLPTVQISKDKSIAASRSQSSGRANDMGSGRGRTNPRSLDFRRRLDRAIRRNLPQS